MMALLAGTALAVDGRWLGPAAEVPETTLQATAGANVAVYGVSPLAGVRATWSPAHPVTLGASTLWIGPTATTSTAGARVLLLDHSHLRLAALARGALATHFDGSLGLLMAGAGLAAESQLGPLTASLALPLAGLDHQRGPLWLPGLWDTRLGLVLGQVHVELGVATSLTLATAAVRWRAWQLTLTSNLVTNALTLSWTPFQPGRPT
jgi:hypothetical protein